MKILHCEMRPDRQMSRFKKASTNLTDSIAPGGTSYMGLGRR